MVEPGPELSVLLPGVREQYLMFQTLLVPLRLSARDRHRHRLYWQWSMGRTQGAVRHIFCVSSYT